MNIVVPNIIVLNIVVLNIVAPNIVELNINILMPNIVAKYCSRVVLYSSSKYSIVMLYSSSI